MSAPMGDFVLDSVSLSVHKLSFGVSVFRGFLSEILKIN